MPVRAAHAQVSLAAYAKITTKWKSVRMLPEHPHYMHSVAPPLQRVYFGLLPHPARRLADGPAGWGRRPAVMVLA